MSLGETGADVLVLGAGASGLAAAAKLTESGCTVLVLEARLPAAPTVMCERGGVPLQAELACPVANTLFFAGEATEQAGHQATVHGALYAGQRAADEVLRTLSS